MKKIGEIRKAGLGGIPLRDAWGNPREDLRIDMHVFASETSREFGTKIDESKSVLESQKEAALEAQVSLGMAV